MNRTIFIGDIQGCFDEWMKLLEKLNYQPQKDELVLLGDVINRGPKNKEVIKYLLKHPEIKSVMGNHEYHYIKHLEKTKKKKSFQALDSELKPMQDKVLKYLKKMPMYLETENWIAVHAGLEPGRHPSVSSSKFLCTVRQVGMNGEGRPWFDLYHGKKWVVFGHWAIRGLICKNKVRGLDTGCVYGGSLTAWIYPDDQLVSVPASKMHFNPFEEKK
jgi:bis(5'-nucleosyl)-tetraphosphatase (symmetrical)